MLCLYTILVCIFPVYNVYTATMLRTPDIHVCYIRTYTLYLHLFSLITTSTYPILLTYLLYTCTLYLYALYRYPRIRRLHHLSNISQTIGHSDSESLNYYRDNILHILSYTSEPVYFRVSGMIFDRLIGFSTDSEVYKVYKQEN